ncbi:MAG: AMP-binding protein [Alphaproteobacteria bacterium]|nr:MAG: AMP-binding protein [Alphaproteobacteria bacterium]
MKPLNEWSYLKGNIKVPLLKETIGACLDRMAAQHPNDLALVVPHQDIRWTYLEYQEKINQFALGLVALGVKKFDRVGIWAPNCSEWCLAQFATAKIGAILVCINPAYRLSELEYALNKVECKVLIMAGSFKKSDYLGMIYELAPELTNSDAGALKAERLPHLKVVISLGGDKSNGMYLFSEVMEMLPAGGEGVLTGIGASLDPYDAINIQFTSGTTGSPKGATLTHHNILNNGYMVGEALNLDHKDRLCIPVPLYHCFGMVMGNLACLSHGAAVVLPGPGFDPAITLKVVSQEKCTGLYGVPTMFIAMLSELDGNSYDLSSLRTGITAGAPCPEEVMKNVMRHLNMKDILNAYGQTETSPVNHITLADDSLQRRVSSVGKACPHVEIKIINEDGQTLLLEKQGEICCRGYNVMLGYWNDDQQTQQTIDRDGWLHSGDLGAMDCDGYVKITGRIKDMIIRGGENIYPREVEEFLHGHPAIEDVQVFGIPHEKFGEQVCVWIILKTGEFLQEGDILDYCRNEIAYFKIPQVIKFVDEFPVTVTGKPLKYIMREMMQDSFNLNL